ncbi:MAG: hypothetical protein KC684_05095 [Candidatus Omnitrophica bacterium]|nr:hypothetical protein [Candidatus Omnitrophota bacterium]
MKYQPYIFLATVFLAISMPLPVFAQDDATAVVADGVNSQKDDDGQYTIFDDSLLLKGYANTYRELPKDIILEMIKDDTLNPFKTAAAVKVLREEYGAGIVSSEKKGVERILLRRLSRTDSAFVQVQIMHTLCKIDRYRYFQSMVPALIQKLDHYNSTVNETAFEALNDLIESGSNRAREARIVFNTLRKGLFLSRKRLETVKEPGPKLRQKLKLIRWCIKILGNAELKRLPKEVINLL